ncbi:MAG: phage major capsid protein [Eubacteriales bacterium]
MLTKRSNEIKERKLALLKELDTADEARVTAIAAEVATLETEETQIRSKLDLAGKLGKVETKAEGDSESEKRGKALLEKRSVTIASTGVILPAYQANDIKPTFNEVSTLVDRVTIKDFVGGESYKQPYLVSYGEGGYTTEGGTPTDAEPTFAYAEVTKTKITAYAEDSEELTKLPAANYDAEVIKGISVAQRKKLTKEILIGDGNAGHFVGIFDNGAAAIDAATDITFAAIDEETLDEIIFSFGGNEDVEDVSVLVLNKLDVKAFAKLRDANGRKIHEVKSMGNSGTIDGVPYIINSNCKAISAAATTSGQYCMAYGPLTNYTMAVFSNLEVARSTDYKFKEGMIAHRGVIFAGGNVTARNGFLRVKRT